MRHEHELPESVADWGWKFHHLGIPTNVKLPDEKYIPHLKFYVSGFSTSPFGIEWMRFEDDSPFDELIKTVPHLAFEVDHLEYEITTRSLKVITESNYPSEGIKVAMIEHDGAPIELMEFDKKNLNTYESSYSQRIWTTGSSSVDRSAKTNSKRKRGSDKNSCNNRQPHRLWFSKR